VICAVSDPSLQVMKIMLFPCLMMFLCCIIFTRTFKSTGEAGEKIEMRNPFAILPALEFALLFSLIAAIAYGATNFPSMLGSSTAANITVGFTALGGFVSSGAVVAPLSSLAFNSHLSIGIAGIVGTAACIVSTLNKMLLVRLCCKDMTKKAVLPFAVTAAVGIISLVAVCFIFL
jgi:uncharacterized membrane protein (DUF4010 family)